MSKKNLLQYVYKFLANIKFISSLNNGFPKKYISPRVFDICLPTTAGGEQTVVFTPFRRRRVTFRAPFSLFVTRRHFLSAPFRCHPEILGLFLSHRPHRNILSFSTVTVSMSSVSTFLSAFPFLLTISLPSKSRT